jgi:hypothetical protein
VREGECGPPFRAVASKMKSWVARSLLKAAEAASASGAVNGERGGRRRAAAASSAVDGERLGARSTASSTVRERAEQAKGASKRAEKASRDGGGRNRLSGIRGGGFRKK